MPQLRQNIVTGDWVVVCPERAKRPHDFVSSRPKPATGHENCPFCVGSEGYKHNEKVRKASTDHVYVIENRYPAFIQDETQQSDRSFYLEDSFYRARPSLGDHEVIIVKEHDTRLALFPKVVMDDLLEMIRQRYIWMQEHEKVVSIMPIYNHGGAAGASIDHPHAQIFASGIVANMVGREMDGADRYYGISGTCVYCDIVKHELKEKVRVVAENDDFVAFCFYASRFPFETWIVPKRHESRFEQTSKRSMELLAGALLDVLQKIDIILDNPALNFYIHTLPTMLADSASYHWHLEIVPRVTTMGGFEMGSEVIINVMSPEEAAKYLSKRD